MAYNQPYYNGGYYPQYQNGAVPDMLGQYKGQYQQPIQHMQNIPAQNMQMPIPPISQKPTNELIWVQGLEGAKGFLVAPNNTVVLWDTENPVIYVKSADASGIPSMRVLDFTERNTDTSKSAQNSRTEHICTCGDKFATKEKIVEIEAKISELEGKYEAMAEKSADGSKKKANKPKEVEE